MSNLNFDDIVAPIVYETDGIDNPELQKKVSKFVADTKALCHLEQELWDEINAIPDPDPENRLAFGYQEFGIDCCWRVAVHIDEIQVGWLEKVISDRDLDRWYLGKSLGKYFNLVGSQPQSLDDLKGQLHDVFTNTSEDEEATNKWLSED